MNVRKLTALPWNPFPQRKKNFFLAFLLGCVVSLFIHFFIFKKIGKLEIGSFNPASFDSIVPRKFHLERVKIDPKSLEDPEYKKVIKNFHPVEIALTEKKNFSEESTLQHDNIRPRPLDNKKLLEEKPNASLEESTLASVAQEASPSVLSLGSSTEEASLDDLVSGQTQKAGGYSQLDELIQQKEPLTSQTAPILLPTDLLFEYNADQLKADAQESLKKLALLIQRNPKAQFIVEGFTDSFGSDEYNLDLSSRRANSIKQWLINNELVNPNQVQAYGLGKTHFIVPSTGTIQQQSLNRRVEIVIRQDQTP